jgi:hypothetical protein
MWLLGAMHQLIGLVSRQERLKRKKEIEDAERSARDADFKAMFARHRDAVKRQRVMKERGIPTPPPKRYDNPRPAASVPFDRPGYDPYPSLPFASLDPTPYPQSESAPPFTGGGGTFDGGGASGDWGGSSKSCEPDTSSGSSYSSSDSGSSYSSSDSGSSCSDSGSSYSGSD